MNLKKYKKKKELRNINEVLNQKLVKSKTFKTRFLHLITKRPTLKHKTIKHSKRRDIKIILKKELRKYQGEK